MHMQFCVLMLDQASFVSVCRITVALLSCDSQNIDEVAFKPR